MKMCLTNNGYIILGFATLVVVIISLMSGRAINDRQIDYDVDLMGTVIPEFRLISITQITGTSTAR